MYIICAFVVDSSTQIFNFLKEQSSLVVTQCLFHCHCGPRANENFPLFSYLSDSKDQTIIEKVLLANDRGN